MCRWTVFALIVTRALPAAAQPGSQPAPTFDIRPSLWAFCRGLLDPVLWPYYGLAVAALALRVALDYYGGRRRRRRRHGRR